MKRLVGVMGIAAGLGACAAWEGIEEGASGALRNVQAQSDLPPTWTFDHPDCWLRDKSGYGVALTGENPTRAEMFAEIRRLSQEFRVPVEIIGGVMEQESLGVQYGLDGVYVHNRNECRALYAGRQRHESGPPGLGLMQLTGGTAQGFDIPRLITDWRYNMWAGAWVLDDKWKRIIDVMPPDLAAVMEANRDVLENWYYPTLAYNSFYANSPYPGRVWAHMASPNAQMEGLVPVIEVASPEVVVPNFNPAHTWEDFYAFAVEPDGTWRLEEGRTIRGPMHMTQVPWREEEQGSVVSAF